MASILITAATGHLGQLVVDNLLASGVPAQSIAVAVRNASKAESLGWTAKGIQARKADYLDGPEVWAVALKGIERVLLISSSDLSTETARLDGQLNIIRAAEKAGVKWIAYTSLLHADTNPMKLAEDHVASEAAIVKTGIPYVFLRNGWYTENYTQAASAWKEHGAIVGVAPGDALVNSASRADYAAAASLAIRHDTSIPPNSVLELTGDDAYTLNDMAKIATEKSGTTIVYKALPQEAYEGMLQGFGLPPRIASILADADFAAGNSGALRDDSHTLSKLLGRKTTPVADTVSAAFA